MTEKNILEIAATYPAAFKQMNPNLIDAHFTKTATKTGFIFNYENDKWLDVSTVKIPEIKEWAATFNKEGIMPDTQSKMSILDAQDRTAVVKLEMEWLAGKKGCDYILLIKEGNQWKIETIIYQSVL
jgi:hypothetical protein